MSYKLSLFYITAKEKNPCTDLNMTNVSVFSIQFKAWKEGIFSKFDTSEQDTYFWSQGKVVVFLELEKCPFSPTKIQWDNGRSWRWRVKVGKILQLIVALLWLISSGMVLWFAWMNVDLLPMVSVYKEHTCLCFESAQTDYNHILCGGCQGQGIYVQLLTAMYYAQLPWCLTAPEFSNTSFMFIAFLPSNDSFLKKTKKNPKKQKTQKKKKKIIQPPICLLYHIGTAVFFA